MTTRMIVLRHILFYGLLLLILYIMQTMVFNHIRVWNVNPLIIPLAVVGAALFGGTIVGGIFGIAAGLLSDMSVLDSTVLFTLFLPAAGILIGLLGENILARGFPSFLLCSLCLLVVVAFGQMFEFLAYHGEGIDVLGKTAFFQTLYSLIFVIPVYYSVRAVNRRLAKTL